jgi:hypothetical protein
MRNFRNQIQFWDNVMLTSKGLESVVLEKEVIYPVKYMTYLALADEAAAKIKKEIGKNMASISFPLGEIVWCRSLAGSLPR